ncbi:MAG: integrase, partial [Gemmatimonadetes bacterium]|nr:integrase [Gemmatimonadota bacterium]MYE71366.1 integrase [Gemmatimonadota bacterium]MYJ69385.1 integrase [Gemmatimonadota bacterium]
MTLRTAQIRTLEQVRAFLEGNQPADFESTDRTSAYAFVRRTLADFDYHDLRKPDKGLVKRYLEKVTGLSRAQVTRLVRQHRRTGNIRDHRRGPPANAFQRRYTSRDAALLAEIDEAFGQLSGPATKVILHRMFEVYRDRRFERLARISNGHIYNLRKRREYRTGRLTFRKTRPTPVPFGVRRKPRPDGQPGFLRVDTVHLGDRGGRVRGWRGALRVRGVLRT